MPPSKDHENLQLGDTILVETAVDEVPLVLRGRLSNLLPKVVWVNVSGDSLPILVKEMKEGHPVRLSAARAGGALVGDTTYRSCLGLSHRLVAFDQPTELTLVDRRAQMRVAMRKSIGVRLARTSAAGGGGHFSIGTTIDVGATGIRFETAAQMAVGDHIFVALVLEGNRQFYAMAQIVRMDDTRSPLDVDPQLPGSRSQEGKRHIRAAAMWDAMAPTDRARLESFLLKATAPSPS